MTNSNTNTTSEQLSIVAPGDNIQTVTTVPQIEQLKAKVTTTTATTAAEAASSSSSALAKFNRIIDSTMERPQAAGATLPQLSSATLQQRFNLAYPELVNQQQHHQHHHYDAGSISRSNSSSLMGTSRLDRGSGAVASTPLTLQAHNPLATAKEMHKQKDTETSVDERLPDPQEPGRALDEVADYGPNDDDHPHHDEDNQMKRNDVHYLLKQLNSFSDIEEIEIVDMKQREQRQRQRHQQQQHQHQQQQQQQPQIQVHAMRPMASSSLVTMVLPQSPTPASPSTQSHKLSSGLALQQQQPQPQFDDYLFESCHYLETNYFAATYRTAMVESSSHEFRPSTNSSSNSFELHEMEPPSVICKAAPPSAQPPPPAYHQLETRLTSSGVQTELTAESLAKLSNSNSTSSSSSSRAPPFFFRCCYTPIDRWREKRQQKSSNSAAGTGTGGASGNGSSGTPPKNV